MDLSNEPSRDEARIMERPLYRPGQTPLAAKKPASPRPSKTASPSAAKRPSGTTGADGARAKRLLAMLLLGVVGYHLLHGTPEQRKKILVRLGAAAWLLMLGTISYCIFLPDPVVEIKEAFAEMEKLPPEQRREKYSEIRSMMRDLTPRQQIELGRERQLKSREREVEFMKLSPKEQVEKAKKEVLEERARRAEWEARRAARARSAPQAASGGRGGNVSGANGRGGGGSGSAGVGGGGGGGSGGSVASQGGGSAGSAVSQGGSSGRGGSRRRGSGNRSLRHRQWLDRRDPEHRAMRSYRHGVKNLVRQQLGPSAGGRR